MDGDGARVRGGRWVLAAAGAAVVVAAVAVLPRLLGEEPGRSSTGSGTACVPVVDASLGSLDEATAATAGWVRFCPLADGGAAQRLRHPQGVVTGDLAASVAATLWQTQDGRPECPDPWATTRPTGLFRIEVGLADGRVAELSGDTGCSTRDATLFSQLETTLLMDAEGADTVADPPPPVTCPDRLTVVRTNRDGASADQLVETSEEEWLSTVPLLPLPAIAADVCAYTGDRPRRQLVDQWQVGQPAADSIRAAATTTTLLGAMADCQLDPGATSYVVVLTDATGTARTLAVDPTRCSPLQAAIGTPPVDTYLGLAGPTLVRDVARSRP